MKSFMFTFGITIFVTLAAVTIGCVIGLVNTTLFNTDWCLFLVGAYLAQHLAISALTAAFTFD
jgi:hypothetical protein